MRHKAIALLSAAMLLGIPVLSRAQSESGQDRAATIAALEQRARALQHETAGPKIGMVERGRIAQQRAQIREMIERLEAGQTVAPQDVDRVLRQNR